MISRVVAGFLLLLLTGTRPPEAAANVFCNGNFSEGSRGWEGEGPVDFANGLALLSDANAAILSRVLQFVAFEGEGTLSFEFLAGLSTAVPFGTSPDTVFISLYFVDDPAAFDLDTGQFADALGLLQLDRTGAQVFAGTLSAGTLGSGWQTLTVEMTSTHHYIVPVIELFGANAVDADSTVRVDNFAIRVDRSALSPVVTSMRIQPPLDQVVLTFEDPKGREDAFDIESTSEVTDDVSWLPVPNVSFRCPTPGHFEADVPLPDAKAPVLRFYRVNPR